MGRWGGDRPVVSIPFGTLRQTEYGPGSRHPTKADLRERIGNYDNVLGPGDAALQPGTAGRYGLRSGQPFEYGGKIYNYADTPASRVGDVIDVYHPAAIKTPAWSGNPPQQYPFTGDPSNPAPSEAPFPYSPSVYQSPDLPNPVPSESGFPYAPPIYQQPDLYNPPPGEPAFPQGPSNYQPSYNYTGPSYGPDWWQSQGEPLGTGAPPSPSNIPPVESGLPYGPSTYQPADFSNPPPAESGFPYGPSVYQQPDPTNPAPNEAPFPYGPSTYQPPDPLNPAPNENVLPTPQDVYQPPATETPAAPETINYPDGKGGYAPINLGSLPVSNLSERPATFNLPGFGQPSSFFGRPIYQGNLLNSGVPLPGSYSTLSTGPGGSWAGSLNEPNATAGATPNSAPTYTGQDWNIGEGPDPDRPHFNPLYPGYASDAPAGGGSGVKVK